MDFVEELNTWQEIPLAGNEKECGKICIEEGFPDTDGALATAYDFLRRLKSPPLTVRTRKSPTACFEEYLLSTSPGLCIVSANDTEGIRRGIYKISELLREFKPSTLPEKEERFHPFFKTRISRYRFGSKKYPGSKYELDEDSDFYPDAFLDRLASEGVNAVWFNAPPLSDFTLTDWHPENAAEKKRLQSKLQRNVDQCKRYGIRIFPYLVVPEAWSFENPLLEKHPDLSGPAIYGHKFFCPAFAGKQYLYDSFHQLFSSVKRLGGFLLIVQGEGAAICPEFLTYGLIPCQDRCGLSAGEIFATEFESIFNGIRSADPDADMIAWFYLPFTEKLSSYHEEAIQKSPREIIFQCNAESGSSPVQLGKKRKIGDYWQCITEPSPAYREFSALTHKYGHRLSAKIQVGTSHEVGSVPYVPVSLLTYRKYKELHALGTNDVMQVWGTGGTPGMMNFTAGRLAFTDFEKVSEDEFLLSLAKTLWGSELAPDVAKVWKILSEAFQNYPYSNMIQYFGPAADGVNWPLHAYPMHKPLYPTWGLNNGEISGDNICECLDNHTLEEVVILFRRLSESWREGLNLFQEIARKHSLRADQKREILRVEALDIHFSTAYRIMKFYLLREKIFSEVWDRSPLISQMRGLTEEEIRARKRMLQLIALDPVLGYNPESRGFKYDETSISRGISALYITLEELKRMESGDFSFSFAKEAYFLNGSPVQLENLTWSAAVEKQELKIHVFCPDVKPVLDELFFAFDDGGTNHPLHGHFDVSGRIFVMPQKMQYKIEKCENGWGAELSIPVEALPGMSLEKCRFNLVRLMNNYSNRCSWPGLHRENLPARLNLAFYNPSDMGRLIYQRISPSEVHSSISVASVDKTHIAKTRG